MTSISPFDGEALIDNLGMALAAEPGEYSRPGIAVQDALNVILAHIHAASGPNGLDSAAQLLLSQQIRAVEQPLTELLSQRLRIINPSLSNGEVSVSAAVDARKIVSISLLSLRG